MGKKYIPYVKSISRKIKKIPSRNILGTNLEINENKSRKYILTLEKFLRIDLHYEKIRVIKIK